MNEVILVIDDDVDTLHIIGLILERNGYIVHKASNGAIALQTAHEKLPDLVLMDINMPFQNGFEVTKTFRSDQILANIPIIMLTARTEMDDKLLGFEAGVDDYLTKPAQPKELIAHIKALLSRSKLSYSTPIKDFPTKKGQVIGVLAASGGLGASIVSLSLGLNLREKTHQDVIVAEYRPGQGSLGLYFEYDQNSPTLIPLLEIPPSELTLDQVKNHLIPFSMNSERNDLGLNQDYSTVIHLLLSSYKPRYAHFVSQCESFKVISRLLSKISHYVVLDLGPSISPITEKVIDQCDEIIILASSFSFSIMQARELISDLEGFGFNPEKINIILIEIIDQIYQPLSESIKNIHSLKNTEEKKILASNLCTKIAANEAAELLHHVKIYTSSNGNSNSLYFTAAEYAESLIRRNLHGRMFFA